MVYPKVSCAIVTQESRRELLRDAVRCFQSQTYPNRELVIVYSGAAGFGAELECMAQDSAIDPASVVRVACAPDCPLGAARNLSTEHSRGELICQWDDDDMYHPDRVRVQAEALLQAGADASFLAEQYHLFAGSNEVFLRREARIHGTVMFRRSVACRYPEHGPTAAKGEDTVFMRCLDHRYRVVTVAGRPELYLRRFHGANTWDIGHHRRLAQQTESRSALWCRRTTIEQHLRHFGLRGAILVGLDGPVFSLE
jgi:glycosyltransferase involved in cell wall biosynthesis